MTWTDDELTPEAIRRMRTGMVIKCARLALSPEQWATFEAERRATRAALVVEHDRAWSLWGLANGRAQRTMSEELENARLEYEAATADAETTFEAAISGPRDVFERAMAARDPMLIGDSPEGVYELLRQQHRAQEVYEDAIEPARRAIEAAVSMPLEVREKKEYEAKRRYRIAVERANKIRTAVEARAGEKMRRDLADVLIALLRGGEA